MDELKKEIEKARARVAKFDEIDGFSQADVSIYTAMQTSQSAITAGFNRKDWNCVLEAYVMLEQAMEKIKQVQ